MPPLSDVVIVGAGAAGLAAAIFMKRANASASVVMLDGAKKIGAKILVSGGGRCNVTNAHVTPDDFYGGNPHILRRVLSAFPESATRTFFEGIGVALHEEENGKLFPNTNSAKTVVGALHAESQRLGIELLAEHRVSEVVPKAGGFVVRGTQPEGPFERYARFVLLATGGLSLPKTGSDGFGFELAKRLGHSVVPVTPALDALVLYGNFHQPLAGIAHDVELAIHVQGAKCRRIAGPMLWTHFGVSGPAPMNASRFWHRAKLEEREVRVGVNFTQKLDFDALDRHLLDIAGERAKSHVRNVLRTWLPIRVAEAFCTQEGVSPEQEMGRLARDVRRRLVRDLVDWPLPVRGTRGYNHAEATAGGVPLAEIESKSMASRVCEGLYLVGEMLDVDGRIGGFNFQWAWASAHAAGTAIARAL